MREHVPGEVHDGLSQQDHLGEHANCLENMVGLLDISKFLRCSQYAQEC